MEETRWWRYVQEKAQGRSNRELAMAAGIDPSALSRWKRGERADVYFAVRFARGLRLNVLETLVAGGFITEEEAGQRDRLVGVEDLSEVAMLEQLLARARQRDGPAVADVQPERPAAMDPGFLPPSRPGRPDAR